MQQHKEVTTSTETQINEFDAMFEKDFSAIYFLSTNIVPKNAWYVDSGVLVI
jgi:hypothetical protein